MSGRITDTGFAPPAYIPVLEDRINYDGERMTDYSAFLPKIGVIYHLNEEQSIGLNYQKGYRAGGSDINEFTQNTYSFDPEYTDTVELTFRSESIDKKTRIMLNMFYTKWKDMQVTVYRPGSVYDVFVDNSGASTLYGTELSISHYLNDDLNVFLTAAYVKTRFDKYVSLGEDYSGNAFTFAPELAVSVGGEYYLSETWLLSADVNYQSESYGHPSNVSTSKIAPYALVNAKIGYKEKDWSVFLYGRNLTNEIYATQYYLNDNAERNKLRTGEPRFLGLQINLNF
jgi:outer membrane receptor protein involved in Fe transport